MTVIGAVERVPTIARVAAKKGRAGARLESTTLSGGVPRDVGTMVPRGFIAGCEILRRGRVIYAQRWRDCRDAGGVLSLAMAQRKRRAGARLGSVRTYRSE